MISEVIISDNTHKCCICGKPTQFIEINYQAPFCSDECIAEMDKQSGVKESNAITMIDRNTKDDYFIRKTYDLCPECMDKLEKFLYGGKFY